jgi:hypothetical protein
MASRRLPYFQSLSLLLFVSSLVFFWQSVTHLSQRDYVAAGMLIIIGFSALGAGSELARLALAERDG